MGEEEASMVAGRSMCVLFVLSAALLQVNFGAGVEMEVQMLDLDRMQQDLVEADEGNAQTLDEIHSYGNGHVDHLEQLSRELEMEDSARANVGAMLDRESNHFNKISAEDPNYVRARAHKEQSLESGLLSRLDDEIANVKSKKSPKRAHKKAASQNHAATKAAHVARKTKATKAHTKATKASKIDTVIDAAQDEENAILRLHNEEQHQLGESNNDSNDNDPMEEIATAEEPDATEGAAAAEGLTAFPTDPPDADSTASGNGVRVGGSVPTSSNAPDGDDDEESDDGATTTTTTTTTSGSNAHDGDDDEERNDGRGILKESSNAPDGDDDEESDDGATTTTTTTTDGATTTSSTTTSTSNAPDGD